MCVRGRWGRKERDRPWWLRTQEGFHLWKKKVDVVLGSSYMEKPYLEQKACMPHSIMSQKYIKNMRTIFLWNMQVETWAHTKKTWAYTKLDVFALEKNLDRGQSRFWVIQKNIFAGGVIQKINVMCERTAYTTSPTADITWPCNRIIITCATGLPDQTVSCKNIIIYLCKCI